MNTARNLLVMMFSIGLSATALAQDDSMSGTRDNVMPNHSEAPVENKVRAEFSDEELQNFADVQKELQQTRAEYGSKIKQSENPEQEKALQKEATQQMAEDVQDAGLTLEKYSNIALAVRSDPNLRDKVKSMLN